MVVEVKDTDSFVELLCSVLSATELEDWPVVIVPLKEVLWLAVALCVAVVVAVPIPDVGYGVLELVAVLE